MYPDPQLDFIHRLDLDLDRFYTVYDTESTVSTSK